MSKIFPDARRFMVVAAAAAWAASAQGQPIQSPHDHEQHRDDAAIQTPASLKNEHHHLHEVLARASGEAGRLGEAARKLRTLLDPHFRREEEIATPPLGLLAPLSRGDVTPEMRAVLPMSEALERELPAMLEEHRAIRGAVAELRTAAEAAGRDEYVRFSDSLAAHARQEEEILYPAAVVVGRFVAQALNARHEGGTAGAHDASQSNRSAAAGNAGKHSAECSCQCCMMMNRPGGGAGGASPPASVEPPAG